MVLAPGAAILFFGRWLHKEGLPFRSARDIGFGLTGPLNWVGRTVQSTSEAARQKWYYDRKANAISLDTGDMVLVNADAYKGKRNVKDQWEKEPYEVEH